MNSMEELSKPSYEGFVNPDTNLSYQNLTDAAAIATGFATASAVDFGASIWNSITPESYNTDTRDLLARVSDNALAIYDEHPDAVHAASFIGGVFVPSGLALKGMNMARAGIKGAGWFSDAAKAAQATRAEELFRQGSAASETYSKFRKTQIAQAFANNTLDAAAMELAVAGTMSAHPFMEDYWKDGPKQFLTNIAIGGVIGGALGTIADRAVLRGMEGKVASETMDTIFEKYSKAVPGMPVVNKLQQQQSNIEILKDLAAEGNAYDQVVRDYAGKMLLQERAEQAETFAKLSASVIDGLPKPAQEALLQKLAQDERFVGVDAIKLAEFSTKGNTTAYQIKKTIGWLEKPQPAELNPTMFINDKGKGKSLAYSQAFDLIGDPKEVAQVARAVDIGVTEKSVYGGASKAKDYIRAPDVDAAFTLWNGRAAEVDKMYAERLAHVDKLNEAQLAKAVVSPDDLPTINALVAKAMASPDGPGNLKVLVTKAEPNYSGIAAQVFKEGGVTADHHAKMLEFTNPQAIKSFDMVNHSSSLSSDAKGLLSGWRAGTKVAEMRTGADAFFRGGYGGRSPNGRLVGEMYNSSESVALRQKFAALADADGNVYLWRGMKQNPRGHAALESYTTDIEKAKEFGTPKLFKVHVDDILGAIADIGSKDGIMRNEIIVGAPARQMEARLPVQSSAGNVVVHTGLASTTQSVGYPELHRMLVNLKEDTLNAMIQQGYPAEVMAIRTNTPVETVKAYIAGGGAQNLDDLMLPYMEYSSASKLADYLGADKRSLILRTNLNKIPYAQLKANADQQMLATMNQQIMQEIFATSKSGIVRGLGDHFFGADRKPLLDLMRKELANAVDEKAGNKFLQSSDFFVRNMENFGKIAVWQGGRIQHMTNEAISKLVKPINEAFTAIVGKGVEAVTEFNTAIALNAGLKGQRKYNGGQFLQAVKSKNAEGKTVIVWEPVKFQGREFKVVTPEVDAALKILDSAGTQMYELVSTKNKLLGIRPMSDLGFWVPSHNPNSKWITYVHDQATAKTQLIWGNTKEQRDAAVEAFKAANAQKLGDGTMFMFDKAEQELVNKFVGRDDVIGMSVADVSKQHSGSSAPAIISLTRDNMEMISQAYEHYTIAAMRNLADIAMHDVTGPLSRMAEVSEMAIKNQPLNTVQKLLNKQQNTAKIMHNTMLGVNNLNEYQTWKMANTTFETVVGYGLEKVSEAWDTARNLLPKRVQAKIAQGKERDLAGLDYETFAKQLEEKGIVNPFASYDEVAARKLFGVAKIAEAKEVPKRMVYAGNALAATVALRIGDIAQPLVNAMSLPILMTAALSERLPANFMGKTLGTAKINPVQAMYEGMRAAFSSNPMHQRWNKMWEEAGYYTPLVSEASKAQQLSREFEPGILAAIERGVNKFDQSNPGKTVGDTLAKVLTAGADYSESAVRRIALFTGGNMAKRMYPELDDVGVTIFAREFMDRVVGNYNAAQRPTMFAGTAGVAMGLFQTYMVTMAQSIYRKLELGDYKGLAKTMLAQGTIFGAHSLPGFNVISEHIGEHFSDDNVDLVSGTFRALPEPLANMILYGLPSSMGPAFYTRGEISPRMPSSPGELPSVNMAIEAIKSVGHVANAMTSTDGDAGRAMMQALSMQSISRPIARLSELAQGYSTTSQGNTIATPEEVWSPVGITARLLATRPLEEAKLRDAIHLKNVYGAADFEERQKVTMELKTAIRNNTLSGEKVAKLAEEYLRTGTPQGWRSAVNTAIATTNTSGKEVFLRHLKPNNPLMHMIDSLDE